MEVRSSDVARLQTLLRNVSLGVAEEYFLKTKNGFMKMVLLDSSTDEKLGRAI